MTISKPGHACRQNAYRTPRERGISYLQAKRERGRPVKCLSVAVVNNLGKTDPVGQQPEPEERGRPGCSWPTAMHTLGTHPLLHYGPAYTENVSLSQHGL